MEYIANYLDHIRASGKNELADAIKETIDNVAPRYINNFSFTEHVVSLLVGDVQSGKTSHMFGIMCAAAEQNFGIFVLLTTDSVILQQQTFLRAQRDLGDFCVCDENDYAKFLENALRKPVVVVLKKNASVLKQWRNNFASAEICLGNPLFIVDDEADAASLNGAVNRRKQTTINKRLEEIKATTSSSIYMQVTGTPQAILLQSIESGWKPYFIYYFRPGRGYMGGNFFFGPEPSDHVIFTEEDEAADIIQDDEYPENGLKRALILHLLTSAQTFLNGESVCNFLIHPSVKTEAHNKFAEKIGEYLNELSHSLDEEETRSVIASEYAELSKTKHDLNDIESLISFIRQKLDQDQINILVMNSVSPFEEYTKYESGINIVIGGNSLGRGVTFPRLQTIYYCRIAKKPQADTMWQHARMFGYDRDPQLLRVFMPPLLYKLFSDINATNNNIIAQIQRSNGNPNIKIRYPQNISPTRKNVLDRKKVGIFSGGVNYFPFDPSNNTIAELDTLLSAFSDGEYHANIRLIITLLSHVMCEPTDWDRDAFIRIIESLAVDVPIAQGLLVIRRGRNIAKGTGTMLSPDDRAIGASHPDELVLTLYKVTGEKGWNGQQLWIPNIKLPGDFVYYSGEQYGG